MESSRSLHVNIFLYVRTVNSWAKKSSFQSKSFKMVSFGSFYGALKTDARVQEPALCPWEMDESNTLSHLKKIILMLYFQLCLGLGSGHFASSIPAQLLSRILYVPPNIFSLIWNYWSYWRIYNLWSCYPTQFCSDVCYFYLG